MDTKDNAIDDYILAQRQEIQEILFTVRRTIKVVLPKAEERISWRMPTFWENHNIIHFAAFKNHLGIYPGDEGVAAFLDRLSDYKNSKGAIQFQYKEPIPYDLIAEIALWCHENYSVR